MNNECKEPLAGKGRNGRTMRVYIYILLVFILLVGVFVYKSYIDYQREVEEAQRQTMIFLSGGPRISGYNQVRECIDGVNDTFECKPEYLGTVKANFFACLAGRVPFEESPFAKRWLEEYQYYFRVRK